MWAFIRRAVLPVSLLLGGVASLIYGAKYHHVPVTEEREEETTIVIPVPMMPDPSFAEEFQLPGLPPLPAPPPLKETVVMTKEVTEDTSELRLVWETTIGGITLRDGDIWRTYSGTPPSLCPT